MSAETTAKAPMSRRGAKCLAVLAIPACLACSSNTLHLGSDQPPLSGVTPQAVAASGGACPASSTSPEVLVMGPTDEMIVGITQDDKFAYYFSYSTERVPPDGRNALTIRRVSLAGGPSEVLLVLPKGLIHPGAFVAAGDFLYFTGVLSLSDPTTATSQVLRMAKSGGVPETVADRVGSEEASWLALDEGGAVYFTQGVVLHGVLPTTDVRTTDYLNTGGAYPKRFAVWNHKAFWASFRETFQNLGAVVGTVPFGAPTSRARALYETTPAAGFHGDVISVDEINAYFAVGSSVMAVPTTGGPERAVATGEGDVINLFADGSSVYWVGASSARTKGNGPSARIYRAQKIGGGAETIVPPFEMLYTIGSVAVGPCGVLWSSIERSADGTPRGESIRRVAK